MKDNPRVESRFHETVELVTRTNLSVAQAHDLVIDLIRQLAEVSDVSEIVKYAKALAVKE
jgi:hypothetical protein